MTKRRTVVLQAGSRGTAIQAGRLTILHLRDKHDLVGLVEHRQHLSVLFAVGIPLFLVSVSVVGYVRHRMG